MTEKTETLPENSVEKEEGLTFENILTEVRVHNCKDRTKLLIDGLNDEIKDVMQAVSKYSKNASIKLTLDFQCLQANELMVCAKLESKKPRGQSSGTKMYRDERGQLYMDDPNQLKLIDTRKIHNLRRDD